MLREHPWFAEYQARTEREFPLVLLTPIDPLASIITEAPLGEESQPPDLITEPSAPKLDARLQKLIDKDDIHECWLQYCRSVDRCDAELMRAAYHDDALEDHGGFVGPAPDFGPWGQKLVKDIFESCMHFVTNFSCELDGDTAHVEFYYLSVEKPYDASRHMRVGRYIQRYEKRDGRWAIAHGICLVDCDDTSFYEKEGAAITGSLFVPSMRDRSDPSYARPLTVDPGRFTSRTG